MVVVGFCAGRSPHAKNAIRHDTTATPFKILCDFLMSTILRKTRCTGSSPYPAQ
jgi:hypothetical protein